MRWSVIGRPLSGGHLFSPAPATLHQGGGGCECEARMIADVEEFYQVGTGG